MRAFVLHEFGEPSNLSLEDTPSPELRQGQVRIAVRAIGINYPDLLAVRGQYQYRLPLPCAPGCEVAGTITEVGANSPWAVGQDVAAFVWHGGYAQETVASDAAVMALPEGATHADGAAMLVNYQTAYFALTRRGQLQHGETVLVLGAAGGIGSAAVQIARGLEARVIAGVANDYQANIARTAGANEALILRPGFAAEVRDLTAGRGVDVVLDPLGDWLLDEALRGTAPEGRILVVGFAAGAIPTLKVNRLLLRNVSVIGVAWGAFLEIDRGWMQNAGRRISDLWRTGHVVPHVGLEVPFERLPVALDELAHGRIDGKGVVVVGR